MSMSKPGRKVIAGNSLGAALSYFGLKISAEVFPGVEFLKTQESTVMMTVIIVFLLQYFIPTPHEELLKDLNR